MKRKFALGLAVLMIWLSILAGEAGAQETVTGMVTGQAGDAKGLAGVTLNGPRRYMAMTNSVGEFRVENVVPGRYTISVTQGNNVQRFIVDINGNRSLTLLVKW